MRVKNNSQAMDKLLLFLLGLFLVGSFMGCKAVFGTAEFYSAEPMLSAQQPMQAIWRAAQFHVPIACCAFLSAGILLIPCVILMRGYFLGCGAAAICSQGIGVMVIACGLPALLQLPSLFYLACAGMRMSAALRDGERCRSAAFRRADMRRRFICSVMGIVLCATADIHIVPMLLERIL